MGSALSTNNIPNVTITDNINSTNDLTTTPQNIPSSYHRYFNPITDDPQFVEIHTIPVSIYQNSTLSNPTHNNTNNDSNDTVSIVRMPVTAYIATYVNNVSPLNIATTPTATTTDTPTATTTDTPPMTTADTPPMTTADNTTQDYNIDIDETEDLRNRLSREPLLTRENASISSIAAVADFGDGVMAYIRRMQALDGIDTPTTNRIINSISSLGMTYIALLSQRGSYDTYHITSDVPPTTTAATGPTTANTARSTTANTASSTTANTARSTTANTARSTTTGDSVSNGTAGRNISHRISVSGSMLVRGADGQYRIQPINIGNIAGTGGTTTGGTTTGGTTTGGTTTSGTTVGTGDIDTINAITYMNDSGINFDSASMTSIVNGMVEYLRSIDSVDLDDPPPIGLTEQEITENTQTMNSDVHIDTHTSETPENQRMCTICHDDFQSGQVIRRLNNCIHMYHQSCIDTWLANHRTCPQCRSNVVRGDPITNSTSATARGFDTIGTTITRSTNNIITAARADNDPLAYRSTPTTDHSRTHEP